MKPIKTTISCLTFLSLTGGVYAQSNKPDKSQEQDKLMKIVYHTKPARPTKPLTIKELSGKDLKPDETMHLANGQKAKVSDYLASMNALERKLNKLGYSLRDGRGKYKIAEANADPATAKRFQDDVDSKMEPGTIQGRPFSVQVQKSAPVKFSASDYDTRALSDGDKRRLTTNIDSFNAKQVIGDSVGPFMVNLSQVQKGFGRDVLDGNLINAPRSLTQPKPKPPKATDHPYSDRYSYNWHAGTKLFGLSFNYEAAYSGIARVTGQGTLDNKGSNVNAHMSGDFTLTAFMVLPISVLKLDVAFSGDGTNGENLKGDVYFMGNQIWSKNDHLADGGTFDNSEAIPFDESGSWTFPVAPGIFVQGAAGISGSAGIDFSGTLYSTSVHAQVTPFVVASTYVQAAAGAGFDVQGIAIGATAGIKSTVLLVDERLQLGCHVGLAYDGRLGLQEELYVKNKLDALKGSVDGYLEAVGGFRYDFNIFKWNGIHQDKTLFDKKFFTPLNLKWDISTQ